MARVLQTEMSASKAETLLNNSCVHVHIASSISNHCAAKLSPPQSNEQKPMDSCLNGRNVTVTLFLLFNVQELIETCCVNDIYK